MISLFIDITMLICDYFVKKFLCVVLCISDNVCIESMSVTISRRMLDKCTQNIEALTKHINRYYSIALALQLFIPSNAILSSVAWEVCPYTFMT